MWSRADLKNRAKMRLKKYFWAALAVTILAGMLGGGDMGMGGSVAGSASEGVNKAPRMIQNFNSINQEYETPESFSTKEVEELFFEDDEVVKMFGITMAVVLGMILVIWIFMLLFVTFVGNPVNVGSKRFFMESREVDRSAGVGKLFYAFGSGHYGNVILTMFMRNLFISLWSLLFVIPGIVKTYQYYMVPYILAENPEMNYKEALGLSKQMMEGNKWNTFVLELSFFGWYFLGIFVCCIGAYFVVPYEQAVKAELYAELKTQVNYAGFNGFRDGEDTGYHDDYMVME